MKLKKSDPQELLTKDVFQPTEQALTPGDPIFTLEQAPLSRKVRSLKNVRIAVPVGEKRYFFDPLGVSEVAAEDVAQVLAHTTRGGGCCGHHKLGGDPIFVLED